MGGAALNSQERGRGRLRAFGGLAAGLRAAFRARQAVIVRPRPLRGEAEAKLIKLGFADFTKDSLDTKRALKDGDYESVMRALRNETDADALNNLGCAYAALALKQANPSYWGSAINALNRSIKNAVGDNDAAKERRARAQANRAIVRNASGLG
jgi:hypothetical protein